MADQGLIFDWFSSAETPVVDITNDTWDIRLSYSPDDDPGNVLGPSIFGPDLSAQAQPVAQALKSVQVPNLGLTAATVINNLPEEMQQAWQQGIQLLTSNLDTVAQANNATLSALDIPGSGLVRARSVPNGPLLIDLWVSGISAQASFTISGHNLQFNATVDAELLLIINWIQWPFCQVIPTVNLFNANLQPANSKTKELLWLAQAYWSLNENQEIAAMGFATPSPQDQISMAEANINSFNIPLPSAVTQGAGVLAQALTALGLAALPFGLTSPDFLTNPFPGTPLALFLMHPIDAAPVASDAYSQPDSFAKPTLAPSQPQVVPGQEGVTVTGSSFTPALQAGITWTGGPSGGRLGSVVQWGPQGGQQQPTQLPATAQAFTPVLPEDNIPYEFKVQSYDQLTTTQWSNSVTTQAPGPSGIMIFYTAAPATASSELKETSHLTQMAHSLAP
jgi:hypothetical protein